jgi:hypothetical protein
MNKTKQISEFIEECRENYLSLQNIIDLLQKEFGINSQTAEIWYQNYMRVYTGTINHELINEGDWK